MTTLIHANTHVNQIMRMVLVACLPGVLLMVITLGFAMLINILVAIITALVFEALMLHLRQRNVRLFLNDGSAIITALLLAVCVPPLAPWWIMVVGIAFAIIVAKHLYGGLGNNIFNPAMVGYVVLLIAFPEHMVNWQNSLTINGVDGVTGATPLDALKHLIPSVNVVDYWPWINIAWLSGGLLLLYKKIITWHIPVSVIIGLALPVTIAYGLTADSYYAPWFQLNHGAIMIGAFFIATDPVTAPSYTVNRLIFGFCIGLLTFAIRTLGAYPDGIAFAILLMNLCVPLLDHLIKPRTFGHL